MARLARRSRWTSLAVAALAALVVFGLAATGSSAGGSPAPALPREHLAGAPVTLAQPTRRARGPARARGLLGQLVRTLRAGGAGA